MYIPLWHEDAPRRGVILFAQYKGMCCWNYCCSPKTPRQYAPNRGHDLTFIMKEEKVERIDNPGGAWKL